MMRGRTLARIGVALVGSACLVSVELPGQATAEPSAPRAVLNRYCVTCHNEKLRTANLLLDKADVENVSADPVLWEKVVRKLRSRTMPPEGAPRPNDDIYESVTADLEATLDRASAASPNPGRPVAFHRLNRAEYTNAVRDLLAVEIDGESLLPDDDADYGFDNVGDALSVSPVLMERYMSAGAKISMLALGDSALGLENETYYVPDGFIQDERMSEDLPFGSRGGLAVRHNFPLDGEYVIRIRLQRNTDGWIRGLLDLKHPLVVRIDGEKIKEFTVGGERKGAVTGPIHTRVGLHYRFDAEQMQYEYYGADENLEVRFPAKAGNRLIQVYFLKRNLFPEGLAEDSSPRPMAADLEDFKGGEPGVNQISVTGPFAPRGSGDTPSRRRIFACRPASGDAPEAEPCARNILATLARRAYRRPVSDSDIQPLLRLYAAGNAAGGFEAGVGRALQGMLVSPGFLFRAYPDPKAVPPDTVYSVSDTELASRLSFFLWSSIPDEELLTLAEQGKLKDPSVLESQVRRMLADPRSESLVKNFAAQWLYLRNLRLLFPDKSLFPDFDDELRQGFQKETELFLGSMFREDRPVTDVLNADYTFLNERLAMHYGIPHVYGSNFRRAKIMDENRRGLLAHGSILTLTSRPNRTSPVLRGKWVLDNLLGVPPPPPPPNVPALEEKRSADAKPMTMRERMEAHRTNAVCASCHSRMDPIGFALDNFDATGRWRADEGGVLIDAAGAFMDGSKFQGPAELRKALLSHPQQFIYNVTEKLFIYALGRGTQSYDQPAIRKVLQQAAPGGYRWSSLILGIVNSTPFQMRRSRPS